MDQDPVEKMVDCVCALPTNQLLTKILKHQLIKVTQTTACHTAKHRHPLMQTSVWPGLNILMSSDKACMLYQSVLNYNDRQGHAALAYQGA